MYRRTTIAGLPTLLVVALLAVGCREAVGPERPSHAAPEFAAAAPTGGIALDQSNGTLNEAGTTLYKGFNPTNPHLGDAIVVTFFWVGSSNIITSVTDYLPDGTPVGNTYSLLEYVTAGGISMATYVATNVQNFPDPNPTQEKVLAVRADLSSSVTDGGVMLSAYSGVHGVLAQAVGVHQSASGSGSSVTTADPGAIAINAGALAYGVTLSSGAAGLGWPTGFTHITTMSDASMESDGAYTVQAAAGSVDPQWTWYYSSPTTWLATALALNPQVTQLAFTVQPSNTTAGAAITPGVQVTAQDAQGNTATGFTGNVTVALGANPSGGTLAGTTTVAAANGVAAFPDLRLNRVGTGFTLVATASGATGASAAFTVTPGPASQLVFTAQPTNVTAGAAIAPAVGVTAEDAQGNTATGFSGTVTVALGANPGGGSLSGTTTGAVVNGVATFANLSINRAGTGYRLAATAGGGGAVTAAASASFNVTPGPASQLVFSVQPSNSLPWPVTITPPVVVTAFDALGNKVTSFTGLVTVGLGHDASLLKNAELYGTKTVSAVSGDATFSSLSISQLGDGYTLSAALAGSAPVVLSAPFNIGPL